MSQEIAKVMLKALGMTILSMLLIVLIFWFGLATGL